MTGIIHLNEDIPEKPIQFSPTHINLEWTKELQPIDAFHFTTIKESMFIAIRITDTNYKFLSLENFLDYTQKTTTSKDAPYGYNPWTREPLTDQNTFIVGKNENSSILEFVSFELNNKLADSRPNTPTNAPATLNNNLEAPILNIRRRGRAPHHKKSKDICIITSTTSIAAGIGFIYYGTTGLYVGFLGLTLGFCFSKLSHSC